MEEPDGRPADIPEATGSTYVPRSEDLGKRLLVRVSFSDDLGNPEVLTSAGSGLVGALVSNFDRPGLGSSKYDHIRARGGFIAQQFTTGSQAGGYTLHSVLLELIGARLSAFIYSDNNGLPGSSLQELTVPETLHGLEFRSEALTANNLTLQADTKYWVVLKNIGGLMFINSTRFAGDDESGAEGWSIGNNAYQGSGESGHQAWKPALGTYPLKIPHIVRLAVLAE